LSGTFRKKIIRYSLFIANVFLVLCIGGFVVQSRNNQHAQNNLGVAAVSAVNQNVDPLDQLSSAGIAATLARMTSVPEMIAVQNQADSANAELLVPPTDIVAISKPQTVVTTVKTRKDIQQYAVQEGDTLASIAAKFGITSDSITWSNGLLTARITKGTTLTIPPANGIVYTVKAGDTAQSLADKYKANKDQIILDNDTEISGLPIGEKIFIANGQQQTQTYNAWSTAYSTVGFSPTYGYNGYDWGFCTWYAANKVPVPSNWGNANTWDNLAPLSGWTVSSVPKVGAVAQTDRGFYGHVAVVEDVSADGTMIKYSDMNGVNGFGSVGYSDWGPASHYAHYIYR
jgi:surface antigen